MPGAARVMISLAARRTRWRFNTLKSNFGGSSELGLPTQASEGLAAALERRFRMGVDAVYGVLGRVL